MAEAEAGLILLEQVAQEVMVLFHAVVAVVAEVVIQLVAQVVEVRQVKLEFGAGNDIKQYNTNT